MAAHHPACATPGANDSDASDFSGADRPVWRYTRPVHHPSASVRPPLAQPRPASPQPVLLAAGVVLAALAILIAVSPPILIYDERYYMESSYYLAAHFDLLGPLRTPLDLAAGPLYPYLHVLLAPLTQLQLPAVRYVNWVALVAVLGCSWRTLALLDYRDGAARAAMLLAVPMIGPTAGMALTEIPALAMASLSVLAATEAVATRVPRRAWLWWTLAGVAAGLAILGRQTYLPALIGFALVGWKRPAQRGGALLAIGLAVLLILPMIVIWGGLSPPTQTPAMRSIAPEYGVLAFIYLACVTLLIAPGFFAAAIATPRRALIGAGLALLAGIAALLGAIRFEVAARVIAAVPSAVQVPADLALRVGMTGVAALFLIAAAVNVWERRDDSRFVLFSLLTVLANGTAAGIGHQFSSRYVLIAFPFALMMLQPWVRPGAWAAARLGLGALLGFASLAAYYWNAPPTDPAFKLAAPPEIVAQMPLGDVEKGIR